MFGTNYADVAASNSVTITRQTDAGPGSPTHYVWANSPTPTWPYTNWATAAQTIQDAVNAADVNDTVLVTNGVYATGGAVTPGYSLTNRVCITQAITVLSVNGPANTFIVGAANPSNTNGPAAVRCVYLLTNAVLSGFTLTNGNTMTSGNYYYNQSGGGVFLDNGGTVSNCLLTGCSSYESGSGAFCYYEGTVNNCSSSATRWRSERRAAGRIAIMAGR